MKRIIALMLAIMMALSLITLTGCEKDNGPSTHLSFSDTNLEDMQKLDGQTVTINGYMSTLSPISGAFMYLLNLPYQSCPFCEPNTTTLSNTIAIYAPDGKKFEFTDRLIRVTGTLEYSKSSQFTDEYGYNYSFRIVDATYEVINTADLGEHLQLWQELAATGVISDVYSMYDYINFLCFWGTYIATWDGGNRDYIYPSDLKYFLYNEGTQFHYGYQDGYFDSMIATIEAVDKTAFASLVDNIRQAEAFAQEVLSAIENEEYSVRDEYTKDPYTGELIFGDGRYQYKMINADAYQETMNNLYKAFATWLGEWEV